MLELTVPSTRITTSARPVVGTTLRETTVASLGVERAQKWRRDLRSRRTQRASQMQASGMKSFSPHFGGIAKDQ